MCPVGWSISWCAVRCDAAMPGGLLGSFGFRQVDFDTPGGPSRNDSGLVRSRAEANGEAVIQIYRLVLLTKTVLLQVDRYVSGRNGDHTGVGTVLAKRSCCRSLVLLQWDVAPVRGRAGFRAWGTTVRVLGGDPGVECQIDFAQMGFITDAETGKRRSGSGRSPAHPSLGIASEKRRCAWRPYGEP